LCPAQIWLIEVNANPCLATNCQVLKTVIPHVVQEALCKHASTRRAYHADFVIIIIIIIIIIDILKWPKQ